ncbi:hypothetical protein TYRP_002414 [Tyrophagus putrescentiae]|nr:hypothetical protein TYRP_002414 [Tyrophagus putrescentiae]
MAQLISYQPPVPLAIAPHLALASLTLGLIFLGWFFTLEVSKKSRNIFQELLTSLVASLLLGFGIVFLMLTTRIYI